MTEQVSTCQQETTGHASFLIYSDLADNLYLIFIIMKSSLYFKTQTKFYTHYGTFNKSLPDPQFPSFPLSWPTTSLFWILTKPVSVHLLQHWSGHIVIKDIHAHCPHWTVSSLNKDMTKSGSKPQGLVWSWSRQRCSRYQNSKEVEVTESWFWISVATFAVYHWTST